MFCEYKNNFFVGEKFVWNYIREFFIPRFKIFPLKFLITQNQPEEDRSERNTYFMWGVISDSEIPSLNDAQGIVQEVGESSWLIRFSICEKKAGFFFWFWIDFLFKRIVFMEKFLGCFLLKSSKKMKKHDWFLWSRDLFTIKLR